MSKGSSGARVVRNVLNGFFVVAAMSLGGAGGCSCDASTGFKGDLPGGDAGPGYDGGAGYDGGNGGGSDGGSGKDGGEICERLNIQGKLGPAKVVFITDTSGSMNEELAGATKWSAAKGAINSAVSTLNASHEFGMGVFPDPRGANDCSTTNNLEVQVMPNASPAFPPAFSALETAGAPTGGTPIGATLRGLKAKLVAEGATAVLVTDGAPNCTTIDPPTCLCTSSLEHGCDPDARFLICRDGSGDAVSCLAQTSSQAQACVSTYNGKCNNNGTYYLAYKGTKSSCADSVGTVGAISDLASAGVPTYVVGFGFGNDSKFSGLLDEMAVAGGTERKTFVPANNMSELQSVLSSIAGSVVSCDFELMEEPDDPRYISVKINGKTVDYAKEASDPGWKIDGKIVKLVGATCAELKATDNVEVTRECDIVTVVVD